MIQQSAADMGEPTVLIVDPKNLRRAGMVELLKSWAGIVKVTLVDFPGVAPPSDGGFTGCRMVILNLGEVSINALGSQRLIQNVRDHLPGVPLVAISDREEADEIVSAVRAGVNGFIPTSIEPGIAVRALTFIMGGGSFFPPTALLEIRRGLGREANDDGPHLDDPGPSGGRRGPLNVQRGPLNLLNPGGSARPDTQRRTRNTTRVSTSELKVLNGSGMAASRLDSFRAANRLPTASPNGRHRPATRNETGTWQRRSVSLS